MVVKERMTPAQATSFERYSVANAAQVKHSLACGCEPYRDVYTYRRWQAQGFQVQRGEKAVKIPIIKTVVVENKDTGAEENRRLLGMGAVFCRHQVQPINGSKPTITTAPMAAPVPTPARPKGFTDHVMDTWKEVS